MQELVALLRDGRKPKIALDIEGTIADMHSALLQIYNKEHGTSWSYQDWYFTSTHANLKKDIVPLFSRVWAENFHNITYEGDTQLLLELATIYDVHFVSCTYATETQIKAYLDMVGLGSIPLNMQPPLQDKTKLDYEIYVDDSPVLATAVAKTTDKLIFYVRRCIDKVPNSKRIIPVKDVNVAASLLLSAATPDLRRLPGSMLDKPKSSQQSCAKHSGRKITT